MLCSSCGKEMRIGDLYCPHCDAPFNPKGSRPRERKLLEIRKIVFVTLGFIMVVSAIIVMLERAPLGGALNGEWVSETIFRGGREIVVVYDFNGSRVTRTTTTHWTESSLTETRSVGPLDFRIFNGRRTLRYGNEPDASFSQESEDVIINGRTFTRQE
ncbi:MAG: zinc ribbon domain-containing protein [Oscillospiraceae bacterium]|nr:zinc ribbon domain-containing protein [Oscillospiraceae bacterium]